MGEVAGSFVNATNDLWRVGGAEVRVTWILSLGAECEEEVDAASQFARIVFAQGFGGSFDSALRATLRMTRALQDWLEEVLGRARVGGGFENHELAGTEALTNSLCRVLDILHVRFFMGAEWGRHADQDCVGFSEALEIGRDFEEILTNCSFDSS